MVARQTTRNESSFSVCGLRSRPILSMCNLPIWGPDPILHCKKFQCVKSSIEHSQKPRTSFAAAFNTVPSGASVTNVPSFGRTIWGGLLMTLWRSDLYTVYLSVFCRRQASTINHFLESNCPTSPLFHRVQGPTPIFTNSVLPNRGTELGCVAIELPVVTVPPLLFTILATAVENAICSSSVLATKKTCIELSDPWLIPPNIRPTMVFNFGPESPEEPKQGKAIFLAFTPRAAQQHWTSAASS
mmetsp:Transcript_20424/g.49592  ORF Transcript_20424/g.49592 Transcript_20424/m.49592 type:complete len:243 (-) Transcript_20424:297-1025(-)